MLKKIQQRNGSRASACQVAVWSSQTTLRLNPESRDVVITCPKCGETRLIERVDLHRWFCAVCAYSWTIGAKNDVTGSSGTCLPMLAPAPLTQTIRTHSRDDSRWSTNDPRNIRPSRCRLYGSPRSCPGSSLRADPIRGSRP
jgi:ribosomal protein L37AE/L43A